MSSSPTHSPDSQGAPSPRHNPLPPEDTPPPQDPLAALPSDIMADILQQAGLHTRQVSHAYRTLHPPLLSSAPHAIDTPKQQLPAAFRTLPPALTSLDLSYLPVVHPRDAPYPVSMEALAAIPVAFPQLCQLKLTSPHASHLPAILATLHACPSLHTLCIEGSELYHPDDERPLPGAAAPAWAPLLQPPAATRLRSLTLPWGAASALLVAPPGALPSLTAASIQASCLSATQVTTLAAAAPALQCLELCGPCCLVHPEHLTALAALTSLRLDHCTDGPNTDDDTDDDTDGGDDGDDDADNSDHDDDNDTQLNESPAPLLHHMRALSNLCHLDLELDHASWAPGCLLRLSHLTHLTIRVWCHHATSAALSVATEVTSTAARHLPQLHSLDLAVPVTYDRCVPDWLVCDQPMSFFHHLAAASQLRQLTLRALPLYVPEADQLSNLQGLTALHLLRCHAVSAGSADQHDPTSTPLQWIAALTSLQQVAWSTVPRMKFPKRLQHLWVLASLPQLRSLQLKSWKCCGRYTQQLLGLLEAVGERLEQLQLTGHWVVKRRSEEPHHQVPHDLLVGLTCLRMLHMSGCRRWAMDRRLQLPASLRLCHVEEKVPAAELQQLRARYPLVVFKQQPWPEEMLW